MDNGRLGATILVSITLGKGQSSIQLLFQQSIILMKIDLLFVEASFSSILHNLNKEFFACIQLLFHLREHQFHQQNIYLERILCMNTASTSV